MDGTMPKITGSTIIKLVILCFLVGLALVYLNISPRDVLAYIIETGQSLAEWSVSVFGKALTYILVGAVVVIPIWLVFYLLRAMRGRR
jgi:uncharacterized oligopeptide transporter (OPT) family protein